MAFRTWLRFCKSLVAGGRRFDAPKRPARKRSHYSLVLEQLEDRLTPAGTPLTAIPGTVGLWHLDEGAGLSTADAGGPNTGSLTNGPVWSAGNLGNALRFDGTNDYVLLKNGPILGSAANF